MTSRECGQAAGRSRRSAPGTRPARTSRRVPRTITSTGW